MAKLKLAYRDRETIENVYVLNDVRASLLGKPAIKDLRILAFVNVVARKVIPKDEFPSLLKCLVQLQRKHCIRLREGAETFFLSSPRRIPISLYEKTRLELQQIRTIGIISPVDEPTEWCAPMVVVLKPIGAVRICLDFTALSRHVLQEWHPIPTFDHTLELLHKAKVFESSMPIPDFGKSH